MTIDESGSKAFPHGLGITTRATVAFILLTIGSLLPTVVTVVLATWGSYLTDQQIAEQTGRPRRMTDLVAEGLSALEAAAAGWVVALVGLAVIVVKRRLSGTWSPIYMWASAFGLFGVAIGSGVIFSNFGFRNVSILWRLSALEVWLVCWGLLWLAIRLVTRPITRELVESRWEIPFQARREDVLLRDTAIRLRIQDDRIVLDRLRHDKLLGRRPVNRRYLPKVVIGFDRLMVVQLGTLSKETSFVGKVDPRSHKSAEIDLLAGHALWLVGAAQQWVIPVDETDGRHVIAIIEHRLAVRRTLTDPSIVGDDGERVSRDLPARPVKPGKKSKPIDLADGPPVPGWTAVASQTWVADDLGRARLR